MGKTTFLGTCPPELTGIAACDKGTGSGLLPIAEKGFDYIEPETLTDLEKFAKGEIFKDKKVLALDNLSTMARTLVKDAALAIPRNSDAVRKYGVPDMKDYGVIAEIIRRTLITLIDANPDKHIVVLAHEKYDRPSENDPPGTESLTGPDLAGQMFLAAPSVFDFVFRLRVRSMLKNPGDAKSRFYQRYLQCTAGPGVIAKCRAYNNGRSALDAEEVVDLETGQGTFPDIVDKIKRGYNGNKES